jgi:hypothetical protein|tara:strand:+ start:2166 stop:2381 length:216 start_codon:yes stop_codon:yes gene_type:complete
MSIALTELGKLTVEEQESILEGLMSGYDPIQVNDKNFMIPKEVNELIDDLFIEVDKLRKLIEETEFGEGPN